MNRRQSRMQQRGAAMVVGVFVLLLITGLHGQFQIFSQTVVQGHRASKRSGIARVENTPSVRPSQCTNVMVLRSGSRGFHSEQRV